MTRPPPGGVPVSLPLDQHPSHQRPSIVKGTGKPSLPIEHPSKPEPHAADSTSMQRRDASPRHSEPGMVGLMIHSRDPVRRPSPNPRIGYREDLERQQPRSIRDSHGPIGEQVEQAQQKYLEDNRRAESVEELYHEKNRTISEGSPYGGHYPGDQEGKRSGTPSSDINGSQKPITDREYVRRITDSDRTPAVILRAFQKDLPQPNAPVTSSTATSQSRSLTAATLIDAIITHQINQSNPDDKKNDRKPYASPATSSKPNETAATMEPPSSSSPYPGEAASQPVHLGRVDKAMRRQSDSLGYSASRTEVDMERQAMSHGQRHPSPLPSQRPHPHPTSTAPQHISAQMAPNMSHLHPSPMPSHMSQQPPHPPLTNLPLNMPTSTVGGPHLNTGSDKERISPAPSSGSGQSPAEGSRAITLGEHIDAIINNDYSSKFLREIKPGPLPPQTASSLLSQIQSSSSLPMASPPSTSAVAHHIPEPMAVTSDMSQAVPRSSPLEMGTVGSSSDQAHSQSFSGSSSSSSTEYYQNWKKRPYHQAALEQETDQVSGSTHHDSSRSSTPQNHPGLERDALRVPDKLSHQSGERRQMMPDQSRSPQPMSPHIGAESSMPPGSSESNEALPSNPPRSPRSQSVLQNAPVFAHQLMPAIVPRPRSGPQADSSGMGPPAAESSAITKSGFKSSDQSLSALEIMQSRIEKVIRDDKTDAGAMKQMPEKSPSPHMVLSASSRHTPPQSSQPPQPFMGNRPPSRQTQEGRQPQTHEMHPSSSSFPMQPEQQQQLSQQQQQQQQQRQSPRPLPVEDQIPRPDASQHPTHSSVTVSAAAESSESNFLNVPTSHHQPPLSKKRMFNRPRTRPEEPLPKFPHVSSAREHVRGIPSSASEMQKASTSSSEKKASEYDFPDSPDDEGLGKTPSSYMALSSTSRSPRRGHVDSSDSRGPAPDAGGKGEGSVGSSVDEGQANSGSDLEKVSSLTKDQNEAQAYESYGRSHREQMPESSHSSVDYGREVDSRSLGRSRYVNKPEGADTDDCSNVSHPSIDSTHSDHMVIDESSSIDSSTNISSAVAMGDRSKSSKTSSPRVHDNSPQCSSDISYEAADNPSQGRSVDSFGPLSYLQRSRSPRSMESGYMNVDMSNRPHSSSDLPSSIPSSLPTSVGIPAFSFPPGQPVVSSMMRDPDQSLCSRDQEPAPLLSEQYETLSDDDE